MKDLTNISYLRSISRFYTVEPLHCRAKQTRQISVSLNFGSSIELDSREMVGELNKINSARQTWLV